MVARSRLADFHMNCQVSPHTVTGCPHDNYHGCLMAYVGLIGNAINAFGYGSEGASLPVTQPPPTFFHVQPPIIAKPVPSLHGNALQPIDSACMFSTCANLQDSGRKCIPSDDLDCEEGSIESRNTGGAESGGDQSQLGLCVTMGVSFLAELLLGVLY
ncbi:hypothetical protein NHX12_028126 [Muraenolepis orangiensis]|uniref:Uncharacterized protein n=1 Tax=Muraenolepis orangiensis TaxID=630683 RepID=A0A9Q0EH05_9TELE|nr:hypothetical protein NHX12_028126 [Muraenolepis orangiensis]